MKDFLRFLMAAMTAIVLASCGEKQEPEPEPQPEPEPEQELTQNLTFTLEVAEVTANSAKVKVSHNGTSEDTWYGFATTSTNINEAISDKYAELTATESINGLKNQTSYTAVLINLEPETDYTYITFGLSEDGELYGKSSSVKFTTERGEVVMEVNNAWKIEYVGPGMINDQAYDHTVTVTSSDKNKYFITGYERATFEANAIKDIAEYELAYLKAYLEEFNAANGTKITIDQMLFEGNGTDALNLYPGEWYAIAIGVDDDGELSGHYAVSDIITIEEEEPTEAYSSWLGNWTWTGSNGIAWDVTIEKGISNMSYYLKGWEIGVGLDIPITWSPENEMWGIYTYNFGVFDFGADGQGAIYIIGNDGEYIYPIEGLPICAGMIDEEGNRTCIGYSEELEDGSVLNMKFMHFIADISGGYYMLSDTAEWPEFPITITPGTETKSEKTEIRRVNKFTNTPRILKTYYESYYEAVR